MVKDGSVETYRYTGDNITRVDYVVNGYTSTTMYEFDNKPNPYYGLIVPGIEDFLTYSRNNITKITELLQKGNVQLLNMFINTMSKDCLQK